jgi:hypothetical protein
LDELSSITLSKLKVNGVQYMVPQVAANPTGTITNTLTSISINNTKYTIP